jgi:hypothetical protein
MKRKTGGERLIPAHPLSPSIVLSHAFRIFRNIIATMAKGLKGLGARKITQLPFDSDQNRHRIWLRHWIRIGFGLENIRIYNFIIFLIMFTFYLLVLEAQQYTR